MSKDYYKILGVDKGASQDQIKKAFRQKAHQYHPDKSGGDETKFKELNEAYQVLGDAKKRSQYDQFGSSFEHAQAGGGFQGFEGFRDFSGFANGYSRNGQGFNFDSEDLGDILGGFGDIFGFGGGSKKTRQKRGRDIEMSIVLEFNEAIFGVDKEISLRKQVKCKHCEGHGAEPGSKIETCQVCGGAGRVNKIQRTILGNMQVQMACDACQGEGKTYAQKCSKCSASGVTLETVSFKVAIPAGIDDGETIRLSGQGEAGEKGGVTGDLYLKVKVIKDKRFVREGSTIKSTLHISFSQAALGDKIDVETVDGLVNLKIPDGTQTGTVFKLRGRGANSLHSRGRGDQLVEVIVKTPTSLSRKQREGLKDLGI
jgi:molecular chaperone DnaJ